MISEIEAYDGECDGACHARFGKTARNSVMFGKPWHWYVYLCYGMYRMLNIVTWPGKHPSAILIRKLVESPSSQTFVKSTLQTWWLYRPILNGPGKLTKNLGVTKKFNWKKADKKNWLWIEDRWIIIKKYKTDKRIGVGYAGEWAEKKWRYFIEW